MHSSRMRTVRCSSRLLEGVSAWGVSAQEGGVCPGGGCLLRRGCLPGRGVSAQEGGVCPEGVSAQGGVCPEGCLSDTPPVDRMTDACENITLPQLRRYGALKKLFEFSVCILSLWQ